MTKLSWPSAAQVRRALGGFPARGGSLCRCPVPGHGQGKGDRHPSLSVRDGEYRLLLHCFAGCDSIDIENAIADLDLSKPAPVPQHRVRPTDPKTTTADALALWSSAIALAGTHGEAYLSSRRLPTTLPTLRFLPEYRLKKRRFSALVAALQAPDRSVCSVQLTLLHRTRPEKAALDEPRRIIGPGRGFALRLAQAADTLGIAEGYETGHAAMLRYGLPVWCSLGATRLPFLQLPEIVQRIVVFADPDKPGLTAAERVREANPQREVVIHRPPDDRDFAKLWEDNPTPEILPLEQFFSPSEPLPTGASPLSMMRIRNE
ncbi:toprim domain-containing protein [Rhizobium sp. NXC24]|uniref:DUF7146 domain-containing protein n=1 Tax=Rhizobium sp. NXC24 TaxID=2048897 RepID=UPI000CF26912|nr:toprim domain-containing protein [Rhizobium sp. NXC24]